MLLEGQQDMRVKEHTDLRFQRMKNKNHTPSWVQLATLKGGIVKRTRTEKDRVDENPRTREKNVNRLEHNRRSEREAWSDGARRLETLRL